jgi:hypothetical protein
VARTRSLGISGLALGMAAAGGFVVYLGLNNVPVLDGLRELASGKLPTPRPRPPTSIGFDLGSAAAGIAGDVAGTINGLGSKIAQDARRYLGTPYVWGGHAPGGFDCSGLVTWVLHHDNNVDLPDNTHTVTGQFYVWSGATTIPRDQCQAGDLVCWPSHIGIAVSATRMIAAPTFGEVVKEENIWWAPAPIIRRVKAVQQSIGEAAHPAPIIQRPGG